MRTYKNGADGVYEWLKKAAGVVGCDGPFHPTSYYNYIFDDVPKVLATIGQDTTNTKLVCSLECVSDECDMDNNMLDTDLNYVPEGKNLLIPGLVKCAKSNVFGEKSNVFVAMDDFLTKDKRYFVYSHYNERNATFDTNIVIACDNCIAYTSVWHTTSSNATCRMITILAPDNETALNASRYLIDNGCNLIIPPETKKCRIGIAFKEYGDLSTTDYDIKPTDADIDNNYNDNLPYDRIVELIQKDESALMLFYGSPGTGKSTLIKHLITHIEDAHFVYFDSELLLSISNASLLNFALDNKKTVFIMEDCEKALVDRKDENPIMNTLLNITDGILGDCMRLKIICTFNTNLDDVDKALLRKGRLKLKYEFKPLSLEKTKRHIPEATAPMTLADIYYSDEENDFSKKEQKKIGFGTTN